MELVVLNSMSGKPTNGPMHTLLILAKFQAITDVKVKNVEMEPKGKMASATKMDVT